MKKIPLFILAGLDPRDNFGKKRLFELKINGQLILEYLVNQAKKSNCFSEIYLLTDNKLKEKFSSTCFFIESKNCLWKNFKLLYNFVKDKYRDDKTQIAVLLSDILPSAQDFQEVFKSCQKFFDKDAILLGTPTNKLRKKRERHFLRKNLSSLVQQISGTGALYIFRPFHFREKLIYFLASFRMSRNIRKVEVVSGKLHLQATENFKGLIVLSWQIIKIIFLIIFYFQDFILAIKVLIRHRKRILSIDWLEMTLTKILVKRKYCQKHVSSFHIEIIDNPVFVEDIDREEDLKIIDIKNLT